MLFKKEAKAIFLVAALAVILSYFLIFVAQPSLQAPLMNSSRNDIYTVFAEKDGYSVKNREGIIELQAEKEAATAINYALNAVGSHGGKVFVAAGNYRIVTSLRIHSNTILEGEGVDDANKKGFGTRLIAGKNLVGPILTNGNHQNGDFNIAIENVAFDGSRSNNSRIAESTGITLMKTTRCRIIDVAIYNCRDSGIFFGGSQGTVEAVLERVSSRGNNYAGLQMLTQSDFHISNCEFGSNGGHGVLLSSCSSGSIIGCHIFLNNQSGIQLYNTMNMRLTGNRANHNGCSGIEIVATMQGRGDYNIVAGNECYDNSQASNFEAGIKINPKSVNISNCLINSNICFDDQINKTQAFGIKEETGGLENLFVGNLCSNNKLEDMIVSGA
ncbi:hypothetical protein E2P60_03515 [Candidatus Bathyarchaeota archaeon]|nr:hypothetical protein E2P60_03515 [Candidatus Bathyarchaeota archaeon]